MTAVPGLQAASDPADGAPARVDGPAVNGLAFGPGWDRQDRWLRFLDPVLENSYRDATAPSTRRRLRTAGAFGLVAYASFPVLLPALGLGSPGPTLVVALIMVATMIASIVAAGHLDLRGVWVFTCAVELVAAIANMAFSAQSDGVLWFAALQSAAIGVIAIAWVRVAWWVAAALSLALLIQTTALTLAQGGDGGVVAFQVLNLALILACATVGNWFLENAERSAFSRGLLVAHLYQRVDHLFRQYLSPDVAQALVDDPRRAELGGEVVEVSVLFADLQGYTPFSERRAPAEVVSMLNATFGRAVPAVLAEGGTIVQFVGDALMAIFNAPLRQPDHALRACRAALALQHAVHAGAATEGTRFRIGINTGPALVGNIGSAQLHNFSALGDTTNVAARLQTHAPEGSVVIGERTRELVGDAVAVRALGPVDLKGKSVPIAVYELVGLQGRSALDTGPAAAPGRGDAQAAGGHA